MSASREVDIAENDMQHAPSLLLRCLIMFPFVPITNGTLMAWLR